MKVECVHCGASGQMDETRIPAGVTSIRCPRCKESFPIPTNGIDPDPAPSGDAVREEEPLPLPPIESIPHQETAVPASPPAPPPPLPDAATPPPQTVTAPMAECTVCAGNFP